MDMRSGSKLNRLQQELPEGLLADAAWMEAHGYSSALRSQYVRAIARPGASIAARARRSPGSRQPFLSRRYWTFR